MTLFVVRCVLCVVRYVLRVMCRLLCGCGVRCSLCVVCYLLCVVLLCVVLMCCDVSFVVVCCR